MIIYFTWDGFGEVNVMKIVNENVVQQCHTLSVFKTVHCKIKFTVKPIKVKADRLSRVC